MTHQQVLAEAWCRLNKSVPAIEIMDYIESYIGIKECLRQWNKDEYPGDSFDAWWKNRDKEDE